MSIGQNFHRWCQSVRISILNFWHGVEKEVIDANDENCGVIIELDANAKLGASIIQGDPNEMTDNGKIMLNIIKRNNLIIANATDKCSGTITRHRVTKDTEEKAVLDYLLFCEKLEPYFCDIC